MARLKDAIRVETWMTPGISLALLDTGVRSIMTYAIGIWAPSKLNNQLGEKLGKGIKELSTLYNNGIR